MGIAGSGFAYDAMRLTTRAVEERRARHDYWREVRRRRVERSRALCRRPVAGSLREAIAAQLHHDVFLASPRECPQCRQAFVLISVRGVELDACLDCGSLWLDAGEFGTLTAHGEMLAASIACGSSRYRCPVCAVMMEERELPGQVRIDLCPRDHGAYFERGELMKLFGEEAEQK